MGVSATHRHLTSPMANDHPGSPDHDRNRVTVTDRAFFRISRHFQELQRAYTDRTEQVFPVCNVAHQYVDDQEVVGEEAVERITIGGL